MLTVNELQVVVCVLDFVVVSEGSKSAKYQLKIQAINNAGVITLKKYCITYYSLLTLLKSIA